MSGYFESVAAAPPCACPGDVSHAYVSASRSAARPSVPLALVTDFVIRSSTALRAATRRVSISSASSLFMRPRVAQGCDSFGEPL